MLHIINNVKLFTYLFVEKHTVFNAGRLKTFDGYKVLLLFLMPGVLKLLNQYATCMKQFLSETEILSLSFLQIYIPI